MRRALTAPLPCAPCYGYQLRAEFEARTGATWPLNVGQVYTALARLERDGLVAPAAGSGERGETQVHYRITDAGRDESHLVLDPGRALAAPARRASDQARACGHRARRRRRAARPGATHRHVAGLRDYTRLKERAGDGDLAWLLVIDSLVFAAEAEIRWLDRCEARLARAARIGQVPGGTTPPAAVSSPTEQARR